MATYFRYDSWTRSSLGPSVPGAQIFVLGQPANLRQTLSPNPPTPWLPIYADVNGLVPIQQPLIADGLGHVSFYLRDDTAFTLAVYLGGALQQYYPDQFPMGASGAGPAAPQLNTTTHSWNAGTSNSLGCAPTVSFGGIASSGLTVFESFPYNPFYLSSGISTVPGTATSPAGLGLYAQPCGSLASVSAWSVNNSGVGTFTYTSNSSLIVGQKITLYGFSDGAAGTALNGVITTVATVTGSSTFTAITDTTTGSGVETTAYVYPTATSNSGTAASAWNITNNVLSLTGGNASQPGSPLLLFGASTGTFLNGQIVTVSYSSPYTITASYVGGNDGALENGQFYVNGVYKGTITGWSIVSNVITFYGTSSSTVPTSGSFTVEGLTHGFYLNGSSFTVATHGGSIVQAPFTHPNGSDTESVSSEVVSPYNTCVVRAATAASAFTLGVLSTIAQQAQLQATGRGRFWVCGMGDANYLSTFVPVPYSTLTTLAQDTNLPFAFAGFRYSPTNASDTTWQCVISNGASTTVVNSGVAADTNVHSFSITVNSSSLTFSIDGTTVATISNSFPSANTLLTDIAWVDNQGAPSGYTAMAIASGGWLNNSSVSS